MSVLLIVGGVAANYRQLHSVFSLILNRGNVAEGEQERRRVPGDGFAVVYIDIAVAD